MQNPLLTSRRAFLTELAALTAGVALGPAMVRAANENPPGKTLFGANIYGWGQYAQRENRKLVIDDVLSALRDCGYHYLENFMDVNRPEENAAFAEKLRAKGLQPVSLYSGARIHETGEAEAAVEKLLSACRSANAAGFEVLSCNPDPIGREKTDEELKTQVSALARLGAGLREVGMRLGIHHHLPEMVNQAREFHYNFRNTKPEDVGFCYDVHWVWKGGVKPADALREYGNRVVTWHLRQSRDGIWAQELGPGDVDYEAVARYASEHKLPRRFTVELAIEGGTKITRSVVENHRQSIEYVKKVFGA